MSSNLATVPRVWSQAQLIAAAEARRTRRRQHTALRRRSDTRIGLAALAVALLVLPGAPIRQSPEICAILAVSAIALLTGQRWALAVIVLAELLLVPIVIPRALDGVPDLTTLNLAAAAQLAAIGALVVMVPGLRATRRAAAALVGISGLPRTPMSCRAAHGLVWATAIVVAVTA